MTFYRKVKKVCVVSDVHLGFINRNRERAFLDFITHQIPDDLDELILLGDIIDPWLADDQSLFKSFYEPIRMLERLDCRKIYVIGNHDYTVIKYLGEYLPDLEVVEYHTCEIDGTLCLFIHGHQYDRLFKIIPPRFTAPLLSMIPDLQRVITQKAVRYTFTRWIWDKWLAFLTDSPKYKTIEEVVWEDYYQFFPLPTEELAGITIFGHTHIPQLIEMKGKYLWGNTGSWVGDANEPYTAIFISPEGAEIAFYAWDPDKKRLIEKDRKHRYDPKEGMYSAYREEKDFFEKLKTKREIANQSRQIPVNRFGVKIKSKA